MHESGSLLQAILDLTGWTQARLTQELKRTAQSLRVPAPAGLNVVTVNRWKQGRQSPSGYYRRLLHHLYEVELMKRREFLRHAALLTGAAAIDPGRLTTALSSRRGIDGALLDSLEAVVHGYTRLWYVLPPDTLLAPTRSQLGALNELRAVCQPGSTAARLDGLTANLSALVGWLSWLSGNRDGAATYYALAHGLAAAANDDGIRAFVLVLRSFMCSDLFRSDKQGSGVALALLDEGVELAGPGSSPYLRLFALSRRAEEHAISGVATAALRDLDRAEQALLAAPGPDPGFFGYWNQDRVAGCRGTCAAMLGRPNEAVALLSRALASTPGELAAERSVLLTDLAAAYAQQAEVDRACEALRQSLAVGSSGDANRIERILAVRQSSLHQWRDAPAVMRLDEELREARAQAPRWQPST